MAFAIVYLHSEKVGERVDLRPVGQTEQEAEHAGHDHADRQEVAHVHAFTDRAPVSAVVRVLLGRGASERGPTYMKNMPNA